MLVDKPQLVFVLLITLLSVVSIKTLTTIDANLIARESVLPTKVDVKLEAEVVTATVVTTIVLFVVSMVSLTITLVKLSAEMSFGYIVADAQDKLEADMADLVVVIVIDTHTVMDKVIDIPINMDIEVVTDIDIVDLEVGMDTAMAEEVEVEDQLEEVDTDLLLTTNIS